MMHGSQVTYSVVFPNSVERFGSLSESSLQSFQSCSIRSMQFISQCRVHYRALEGYTHLEMLVVLWEPARSFLEGRWTKTQPTGTSPASSPLRPCSSASPILVASESFFVSSIAV